VHDLILGDVELRREELEDFVIRKSDGWPTYHFACVVDDEWMRISHVIRGQEHLMNTPKHIALQRALGFATPQYAHVPVIFNPDGSKMSKRDKEKALARGEKPPEIDVHDFRVSGYLPEALVNFTALLGWSPGGDREFMTYGEMIELFSVERIGRTAAKFDREKLLSFNTDYLNRAEDDRKLAGLRDWAAAAGVDLAGRDDDFLTRLMTAAKGFRTFTELWNKSAFLFVADEAVVYNEADVEKVLRKGGGEGLRVLGELRAKLSELPDWSAAAIEALLRGYCEQTGLGLGKVAQPLRVAVTGCTISPPIFDSLAFLGREATIRRLARAQNECRAK
jgi:glutamyl-tRNA synthetase